MALVDFTDRHTLQMLKASLHRTLNSIDNEIGAVKTDSTLSGMQRYNKLDVLHDSRMRFAIIFDQIDENIRLAY